MENLTVDRVAEEAGVSRGLVFHYFPSVRELHLACLQAAADDMATRILTALTGAPREEWLRVGLYAYIDYVLQQPLTFLAMSSFASRDDEFAEVFNGFQDGMLELVNEIGGTTDDPLWLIMVRGWLSFVETSVTDWVRSTPVSRDLLVDMMIDVAADLRTRWSQLVLA